MIVNTYEKDSFDIKFEYEQLKEKIQELTLKIGEKIDVRRFVKRTLSGDGKIGCYIHGGKIAVLVEVATENAAATKSDDFTSLVNDLCLHTAAADPKFLSANEIDEDFIEGLLADKSAEELFPVNKSGGRPPKARERFSGVKTFDASP